MTSLQRRPMTSTQTSTPPHECTYRHNYTSLAWPCTHECLDTMSLSFSPGDEHFAQRSHFVMERTSVLEAQMGTDRCESTRSYAHLWCCVSHALHWRDIRRNPRVTCVGLAKRPRTSTNTKRAWTHAYVRDALQRWLMFPSSRNVMLSHVPSLRWWSNDLFPRNNFFCIEQLPALISRLMFPWEDDSCLWALCSLRICLRMVFLCLSWSDFSCLVSGTVYSPHRN